MPPTAAPEPPAVPRGAIFLLAAAAFASGASMRVNDALLPQLGNEFGVSLGEASQVISLFAIAYGLAQLLFGPAGDRFGKYKVIAWAAAACSVTTLVCASASSFDTLRIARTLAGATAAALIPLSMAWIGDVVPYDQRQPVLARFLIGFIGGVSAGVWLGGHAADHWSWRTPYFLIATMFGSVSLALFLRQRRLPAHARGVKPSGGPLVRGAVQAFAAVLAEPWARVVVGLVFLEGLCLYGPFAFIASLLHQRFNLSLSAAGSIVMLFGLGGLAFAVLSQALVRRLGESGLARWGGALMAVSMLSIAYGPSSATAVAGCFALGLGFYMFHNTLQVNATQMAPGRRGAAVAAFASSFFLGQSAGVWFGGVSIGVIGIERFMAAGAVGVLMVGLVFATLRDGRRRLGEA